MNDSEEPMPPREGPHHASGMPHLLWFLGLNMGIGLAMGVAFAALLLIFNIAGLRDLIETTAEPVLATFLLYAMCALTFGSLAMGIAVMTLPFDGPEDGQEPRDEPKP